MVPVDLVPGESVSQEKGFDGLGPEDVAAVQDGFILPTQSPTKMAKMDNTSADV